MDGDRVEDAVAVRDLVDGHESIVDAGRPMSLRDVVDFYGARFGLGLSDAQKSDLVAFLRTL